MRLRTLELRNYRRHRHSVVEFADGVTALVGRNGSGKSSLIEAIGFALFGTAATRTSKDLLRHDGAAPADPVSVVLEFDLANQAIRVERELRGRNLTPSASLSADGVVLVPPGAGSSDAVTRHLEKRLGLNADGFFTTVVARQKELSRLADQKPTERKRLILEMLGVDELDRAIVRARRRRLDAEAGARALAESLADADALVQEVHSAQANLTHFRAALAEAEAALAAALQEAAVAAGRLQDVERRAGAHVDAKRIHHEAVQRLDRAREATRRVVANLEESRAAGRAAEALAPAADALPAARDALTAAEQHARLAAERERTMAAVASEEEAVRSLESRLAKAPAHAPPDDADVAEARRAAAETAARVTRLEGALAVARHNLEALEGRLANLGHLGESAPCPTCERPLADHLPRLVGTTEEARRAALAKVTELAGAVAAAQAAAQAATAAVVRLDGQARDAEAAEVRRRSLGEQLAEARRRHEAAIARMIPEAGPVVPLEPLRQAVAQAERSRDEWLQARARAERVPALVEELNQAEAAEAGATRTLAKAAEALEALPDPGDELETTRRAHAGAAEAERRAEGALIAAKGEIRLAERVLEDALRRRADEQERRKKLASLQEEARYWAALAGARGGGLLDNFKVHLVSRVGPAIAGEASRLLARFTGGRYTEIVLDEHYSITVAEGGVAYPLERFSGGEADVVHLALRLAVSRLLAQRAGGAELRFLALDEVFGSLDAERRELVAGTLEELTNLYSQVVAVTHLEDLQELDHVISVHAQDGQAVVTVRS